MFRRCDAQLLDVPRISRVSDIPNYKTTDDDPYGGTYTLEEWIKLTEPFHLKVKDLTGDSIQLLLLDRNVSDLANHNEGNPPLPPQHFFTNNYQIEYTPNQDQFLEGKALWNDGQTTQKFRFHLDLGDYWFPMDKSGKVPKHMWGNLHNGKGSGPEDRIGWRGPSIPWNLLTHCPKVYYG